MLELKLSTFGLETVPEAAERKKWSVKTLQNWIHADKLAAVVIGTGRGSLFLVRIADVDAQEPPVRGRPKSDAKKPAAVVKPRRKSKS